MARGKRRLSDSSELPSSKRQVVDQRSERPLAEQEAEMPRRKAFYWRHPRFPHVMGRLTEAELSILIAWESAWFLRRLRQKTPIAEAFVRLRGKDMPGVGQDGQYERDVVKSVLATAADARLAKLQELLDVAKELRQQVLEGDASQRIAAGRAAELALLCYTFWEESWQADWFNWEEKRSLVCFLMSPLMRQQRHSPRPWKLPEFWGNIMYLDLTRVADMQPDTGATGLEEILLLQALRTLAGLLEDKDQVNLFRARTEEIHRRDQTCCYACQYDDPGLELYRPLCGHGLCQACVANLASRGHRNCGVCRRPIRFVRGEADLLLRVYHANNRFLDNFPGWTSFRLSLARGIGPSTVSALVQLCHELGGTILAGSYKPIHVWERICSHPKGVMGRRLGVDVAGKVLQELCGC